MKKVVFTLAILFTTVVSSQDFKFGVRGGLNLANISATRSSGSRSVTIDTDGKTSFYVGGFVEFPLSLDKLNIEVGLNYSANGTVSNSTYYNSTLSIDQLNLPVVAKYEVIENLYAKGGIYLGYIMGVETERSSGVTSDAKDNFTSFDMGLSIGTEYNLENGLFFDVGYNLGLLNIIDTDNDNLTVKNRTFQLGLGYKF